MWRGVDEVWRESTNEDELGAVVRFKGNAVGSFIKSYVDAAGRDEIRICGTRGAIVASQAHVTIHTVGRSGNKIATSVAMERARKEAYYRNVRDHLLRGRPLAITPEMARRVIQVLELASRSARVGRALRPKYR